MYVHVFAIYRTDNCTSIIRRNIRFTNNFSNVYETSFSDNEQYNKERSLLTFSYVR